MLLLHLTCRFRTFNHSVPMHIVKIKDVWKRLSVTQAIHFVALYSNSLLLTIVSNCQPCIEP